MPPTIRLLTAAALLTLSAHAAAQDAASKLWDTTQKNMQSANAKSEPGTPSANAGDLRRAAGEGGMRPIGFP